MTNRYHSAPVGGAGYFGTFDGDQELSDQGTIARLNEQARTIAELRAELLTRAEKDAEDTHRLQRYCDGIRTQLDEARGHIAALFYACDEAHVTLFHYDLVRQPNGVDWEPVDEMREKLIRQLWQSILLIAPERQPSS
jgi:hypothetical protein